MKKITVSFNDPFKPGEFDALSELVIISVRAAFPGVIVHTEANLDLWDELVVHAYGWPLGEGPLVEVAALQLALAEWKSDTWRSPLNDQ